MCPFTSLVISNIETTFLPSNTASSFLSARMLRLSLGSWSSCLRTYSQSFLVSSVRGSGSLPTTAASAASGCTGLLRAFLGAAAFFGVGIGQLERAGLGCQAKNQPCFSGSRERHGESQPIVLGPFIRELNSFGNTHDPTSQVFLNLGLKDRSKYLRKGGRAKHAPSKVDPSAQLTSGCSWYFQSQLPSS